MIVEMFGTNNNRANTYLGLDPNDKAKRVLRSGCGHFCVAGFGNQDNLCCECVRKAPGKTFGVCLICRISVV